MFDLVSSNSDLDHPLCEECTDALLDLMDTTLSRTQTQAQLCQQLLASLSDMPETDVSALERELENVRKVKIYLLILYLVQGFNLSNPLLYPFLLDVAFTYPF